MKKMAATLCAAVLCVGTAHAAVLSETQGWSFEGFGDYDRDQPIFNTALGTLDSVQVTVSGRMTWTESAVVTQLAGHTTVMPETNRFCGKLDRQHREFPRDARIRSPERVFL